MIENLKLILSKGYKIPPHQCSILKGNSQVKPFTFTLDVLGEEPSTKRNSRREMQLREEEIFMKERYFMITLSARCFGSEDKKA